ADDVSGGKNGIRADNKGSGALSITVTGRVDADTNDGIQAHNDSTGTDLTIVANTIYADDYGIIATNDGSGSISITTNGTIQGGSDVGIATHSSAGTLTTIVVNGSVAATSGKAITNDLGDSDITVNAGGSLSGEVSLGDGSDSLTLYGDSIAGVTLLDGGDDSSSVDGMVDILSFFDVTASKTSGFITNWEHISLDNSELTLAGDFMAPEQLSIFGGSTLAINGGFTLGGGAITMRDGGAGDKLVVDGDFSGSGSLAIDVDLDADLSDQLQITGTLSGGPVSITANGFGNASGNDILVVDTTGGTTDGDFLLTNSMVGVYYMDLERIGDDWFLTNARASSAAAAYEAYPQVLASLMGQPTLAQRGGGRFLDPVHAAADAFGGAGSASGGSEAVWTLLSGSHSHLAPDSLSDAEIDQNQWQARSGLDALLIEGANGSLFGGLTLNYGEADADVLYSLGDGMIGTKTRGVGLSATWVANNGFYVDSQAQWNWFESDIAADGFGTLASGTDATGHALSLELGQRIDIENGVRLMPQAQLVYSSIDFNDFTDPNGFDVSLDDGDSLILRTGLSAEWSGTNAQGGTSSGYVLTNIRHDFLGGYGVNVAGGQFDSAADEWTGEVGLGGSHEWMPGQSLYGEVSVLTGLGNFGESYSVRGTSGISLRF
ncbi:autotransporter outer membrane beta-barrel domain-containing protein, partial [Oricola sp.]|uniref:autotransporter family protein n=1 Tax=Oricola sp. TaxID=1979950 RepID=UPI0025D463F0